MTTKGTDNEKVEKKIEKEEIEVSEKNIEKLSPKDKLKVCVDLKAKSNDHFRKGQYQEAVGAYQKILKYLQNYEFWVDLNCRIDAGMLCCTCYSNISLLCLKVGTHPQKLQVNGISSFAIERLLETIRWKKELEEKKEGDDDNVVNKRSHFVHPKQRDPRRDRVPTPLDIKIPKDMKLTDEEVKIITKLLFRRGQANMYIQDYEGAVKDVKECCRLNPESNNFPKFRKKWTIEYKKFVKKSRSRFGNFFKDDDAEKKKTQQEEEKDKVFHIVIAEDRIHSLGADTLYSLSNRIKKKMNNPNENLRICLEYSRDHQRSEIIKRISKSKQMGESLRRDMEKGMKWMELLFRQFGQKEENDVLTKLIATNGFGIARLSKLFRTVEENESNTLRFIDEVDQWIRASDHSIAGAYPRRSLAMAQEIAKFDKENKSTVTLIEKGHLLEYTKDHKKGEGPGLLAVLNNENISNPVYVILQSEFTKIDYSRIDKSVETAIKKMYSQEIDAKRNEEIRKTCSIYKQELIELDTKMSSDIPKFCESVIDQIL